MILRILAGLNFTLLAALLALRLLADVSGHIAVAVAERTAHANEMEWKACEKKHETLLRQIKREGLWKRLGLNAQPWLQ